jgi:hypothetical protein
MTLHNEENPTIQAIAARDVVIASTFLFSKEFRKMALLLC